MINNEKRTQSGGDGSTNIQADNVTFNNGITYPDVKEIALDVFKSNFLELAKIAKETAISRAEELVDLYLAQLKEKNPEAISEMENPGMQMAMFEAQKSYAKTGDKDLESLLVDILVERSETTERNLKQIALDEAINIAPKLTDEHISILTLNFFVFEITDYRARNLDLFKENVLDFVNGLSKKITGKSPSVTHLTYTGCIHTIIGGTLKKIESLFSQNYSGIFYNGFTEEEISILSKTVKFEFTENMLIPCLNDQTKKQFSFLNFSELVIKMEEDSYDQTQKQKILDFYLEHQKSDEEIFGLISGHDNEFEKTTRLWEDHLKYFKPTAVGVAIAISNLNRVLGSSIKIEEWIDR